MQKLSMTLFVRQKWARKKTNNVDRLLSDIQTFSFIRAAEEVLRDERTKQFIISLNIHNQLFDSGINSEGVLLSQVGGDYSPVTMDISQSKGKPKQSQSIINLNDTGAFYESFKIEINYPNITISADDSSRYDIPLTENWGKEIIGLTSENLAKVEDFVAERVFEKFMAIFDKFMDIFY